MTRRSRAGLAVLVASGLVPVLLAAVPPAAARVPEDFRARAVATRATADAARLPLEGLRIAVDPGHQLGNRNFPRQINRAVPAGGFTKPCNTTGTATNAGYPEATFTFALAGAVGRRLRALGAEVRFTRTRNSDALWGPCVDVRGRFGARVGADLAVSLHADGARSGARGFHVIAPTSRSPWTDDIAAASVRLARALRAGLDARRVPRSNYLAGGTGLVRRSDLGTLNLSDIPIAMVEFGNMRNAADARLMRSPEGRARYANAIVAGIRRYLGR